jgi:hypothetical protein
MTKPMKCHRCELADVAEADNCCTDCRMALGAHGWRRFAEAMMRGIELEQDHKPSMLQ